MEAHNKQVVTSQIISDLVVKGGKVFIGGYVKHLLCSLMSLLVMTSLEAQWVQVNDNVISAIAVSGKSIFVGTSGNGVYVSTDAGTNWTTTDLTYGYVTALAISPTLNGMNLFVGTQRGGVFVSADSGAHWSSVSRGLPEMSTVFTFGRFRDYMAAGTDDGVFISADNGTSWKSIGLRGEWVACLTVLDTNLFAGTYGKGVFLFAGNDSSWNSTGLQTVRITELVSYSKKTSGVNLIAGTFGEGVFISTDNGTNWTLSDSGLSNPYISAIAVWMANSGTKEINIFAGTSGGGIFLSTNEGISWTPVSTGLLPYTTIYTMTIFQSYVYAGSYGLWRRPLSELTTIQQFGKSQPTEIELSQNYPNPFNPTTTIRYALSPNPSPGGRGAVVRVKLTIHDILGREIATLVNEEQSAGWKEMQWNASAFASGMYLVRMQAGKFSDTKKILLMK